MIAALVGSVTVVLLSLVVGVVIGAVAVGWAVMSWLGGLAHSILERR